MIWGGNPLFSETSRWSLGYYNLADVFFNDIELLQLAEDLEAGTLQTGCHNIAHTHQGHDETQLFLAARGVFNRHVG